jgi:hypothetical protein
MSGVLEEAWARAGGALERLELYRRVTTVSPLVDERGGRALLFLGACGRADVGAVGDLAPAPGDDGAGLLAAAEAALRAHGMREALGPLDGNTFFPYRACVEFPGEPVFAGEPVASYPCFVDAGWEEDARYRTTRCPNAPQMARDRPLPEGWSVRALRPERFAEEVSALYRVTTAAFADAHRYAPVSLEVFSELHARGRGQVDPRYVLLAEDPAGVVQGFVYAWPEPSLRRFVLKTLAVHPDARGARLATHLMARVHGLAASQGLDYGLHALMWEGSLSRAITAHGGETVRRYVLYRKGLG